MLRTRRRPTGARAKHRTGASRLGSNVKPDDAALVAGIERALAAK
jgi:hypothetical protein